MLFNFLIYSSLHYIYSISLFDFHLIMTFWKRRNVVPCFIIFYRRFLSSNVLPNLYLFMENRTKKKHFADASDGEIKKLVNNSVPKNTKESTKYVVNIFEGKEKLRIEFFLV